MTTTNATQSNSAIQQLMKSNTPTTTGSNTTPTTANGIEDRFMTMLVTQMKNQDPLNPMDNAQITSQLAQIDSLKGIDALNTTMQKLLTSYSDALSMQSSSLVGKNVLAAGNSLQLGAKGALGGINLAGAADKVVVSITNASGVKVAEESLGPQKAGVVDFSWDGTDANGSALPTGSYKFSVQASQGGSSVASTALSLGTVSALVRGQNGFQLEIPGTGLVDFNAVQQIF
jgi:flagellar basal-body rod modification protein FlgD